MDVDIYMPRLDVPFKKSIVPKNRGGIPDLRVHWLKFVKCLRDSYIRKGMNPRILELPLWQITPEFVSKQSETAELIYIPHKMLENCSDKSFVLHADGYSKYFFN